MVNICVVILHYNNFQMTQKYLEQLKQLNWKNLSYKIIVVDNNSPDKSGKTLLDKYNDDCIIDIVLLEKNLGFAKGNNVGIQIAHDKYNSDLTIVSNNDIEITNVNFPQELWQIYREDKFDVFGPDIYSLKKQNHQSPFRKNYYTIVELEKKIKKNENRIKSLKIINALGLYEFLGKIRKLFKKNNSIIHFSDRQWNVVVCGAFFVLSKSYLISYPDGLFPGTFMYAEENLLTYRCLKKGLKILYDPKLKVIHYDGVSTLSNSKNKCLKYLFELTETNKSYKATIEYMKKEEQN